MEFAHFGQNELGRNKRKVNKKSRRSEIYWQVNCAMIWNGVKVKGILIEETDCPLMGTNLVPINWTQMNQINQSIGYPGFVWVSVVGCVHQTCSYVSSLVVALYRLMLTELADSDQIVTTPKTR